MCLITAVYFPFPVFLLYFKAGNFIILYTAVGHARMKHETGVSSKRSPDPESTKSPPINIPTAMVNGTLKYCEIMGIIPAILKKVDSEKAIKNKLKVIFLSFLSFLMH